MAKGFLSYLNHGMNISLAQLHSNFVKETKKY